MLSNVPDRSVVSKCETPTEKVLEFLDFHLKPVMQSSESYIKDSGDFIRKIKDTESILSNAILIKAEVVGLYPSIPHNAGIKALKNILDKRKNQNVSTADLIKMSEFILRNNFLNLMTR